MRFEVNCMSQLLSRPIVYVRPRSSANVNSGRYQPNFPSSVDPSEANLADHELLQP
jgi:hypothetical protein